MRALLAITILAAPSTACVTAAMVEQESRELGTPAVYAADPESLVVAARATLNADRFEIYGVSRPDTATRVVLGGKPWGLFNYGEWVRLTISSSAAGTADVRVVSRSGYALDVFHRTRAPFVLQSLDSRLDPAAVLVAGVHLVAQGSGRAVEGELVGLRDDWLILRARAGVDTALALGDVTRASVLRGRVGQAREFALVAALLGSCIGFLIANESTRNGDWFAGLERLAGTMTGMSVGLLAGAVIGSEVKTPVWSDLNLQRLRAR
jgi:hypothetical protein